MVSSGPAGSQTWMRRCRLRCRWLHRPQGSWCSGRVAGEAAETGRCARTAPRCSLLAVLGWSQLRGHSAGSVPPPPPLRRAHANDRQSLRARVSVRAARFGLPGPTWPCELNAAETTGLGAAGRPLRRGCRARALWPRSRCWLPAYGTCPARGTQLPQPEAFCSRLQRPVC